MSCCGEKREALESSRRRDPSGAMLEYRDRRPVEVRGEVSGRVYVFSNAQPIQTVDRRDAPYLLRSAAFRER
jgi:hypothetical protein